jgi:crossover junction endodeoxyribonuclease RuvC
VAGEVVVVGRDSTTSPVRILGLDLSLTGTGYVCPACTAIGTLKPKSKEMARLEFIRQEVVGHAELCDVVVLEGYAYGTQRGASQAHSTGELGGLIRWSLWRNHIPYAVIPPASLKKFVTNKGNASKDEVIIAVSRRWSDWGGTNNNEADAYALQRMGAAFYNGEELHDFQRKVIESIEWPTVVRQRVS